LGKLKHITHYKAELILGFCAIIWGGSFPLVKIAMPYVSPIFFVFIRFLLVLIFFRIIFHNKIKEKSFKDIKPGLFLGITLFLGFITQTIGLKFTSASNSAFITGIYILFIPFIQPLIVKKNPVFANILGIIVSIIGLYLLTGFTGVDFNVGDFFSLLSAIAFAFQIVLYDKFAKQTDHISLLYGQIILMVFASAVFSVFFEMILFKDFIFQLNNDVIISLTFNALLASLLALYLANKYQKYTSPVTAGIIYNSEQVFAVIFAFFILGEVLGFIQYIGGIIIITGVLISEFSGEFFKSK
jgi:drug/metabolite transporter (DMT)-like permease